MWNQILDWEHFDIHLPQPQHDPLHIHDWWEEAAKKVPKEERRRFNGMVIYAFWNIWKERNRRIFNNVSETALQTASREDIMLRKRAIDRLA